jgi:hypothetical protein
LHRSFSPGTPRPTAFALATNAKRLRRGNDGQAIQADGIGRDVAPGTALISDNQNSMSSPISENRNCNHF